MSRNAPNKNKPVAPTPTVDELWRSGRHRFGFQNFRRGRDKKWHFAGQQPGEEVRMVVRKHWGFLLVSAWPVFASIAAMIVVLWGASVVHAIGPLLSLLELIMGLLIFFALCWFIWSRFIEWWLETYIITDKRIINSRGILQPSRQETPIEKVTQIGIDLDSPLGFILSFGTVHVYLVGGDLKIENVPNPKKVKDAIQGVSDEFQAQKPAKEKPPTPEDPALAAVLKKLAEGKPVPQLEDADKDYPPPRNPDRYRGPRRTFGGILHIPCEVRYTSGEQSVMYIQRSQYILYRNLIVPVLLLLIALPLAIYGPSSGIVRGSILTPWWFAMSMLVLVLILSLGVIYTNWADDVYILTNKRIIDIERRLIFFFEMRMEVEYKNIRDVKVLVPNVLERLLDIGNVYIETPGSSPDLTLYTVDHPFFLLDKINEIKTIKEKADAIKKVNESKEELNDWFSTVVYQLEQKTQFKGAPNLQKLDLMDAMERAGEFGLYVVVWGEEPVYSGLPPGRVIHQNPPPGTVISPGGELQVVLSRRPTPNDQI